MAKVGKQRLGVIIFTFQRSTRLREATQLAQVHVQLYWWIWYHRS